MRKFLATLLALTMLVLPVCGLAASPAELMEQAVTDGLTLKTDVSFQAGSLPMEAQTAAVVSDLINAFAFTKITSTAQNSFAMTLSGVEAISFTAQVLEDRLYVKSNLLGEDAVSLNGDEVKPFMEKCVKTFGGMFGMTDAQIADAQKQIEATDVSDPTALTGMSTTTASMFTEADFQPVVDVCTKLAAKAETSDVTAQPKNCDAATQVTTFSLTGADIGEVYDAIFDVLQGNAQFVSMMDQYIAMGTSYSQAAATASGTTTAAVDTPANGQEALEQSHAQINEAIKTIETVNVTMYTNEDALVSLTADMNMTQDDEKANVVFQYDRLTTSDGVGHSGSMIVGVDGEDEASITFSMLADSTTMDSVLFDVVDPGDKGEDAVTLLSFSYLKNKDYAATDKAADDTTIVFSIRPDTDSDPLTLTWKGTTTAAYDGKAASREITGGLYLGEETDPLVTVNKTTATVDAEALLSDGKDVRPGTMEDTDFLTFMNTTMNTAMVKGLTMIQLLPRSFQQLLSGATTAQ